MRMFYTISAVVVFLLILIMSLPQIGTTCSFYAPLKSTSNPAFSLLQAALLGSIIGGVLVLLWKMPKEEEDDDDNPEGGVA